MNLAVVPLVNKKAERKQEILDMLDALRKHVEAGNVSEFIVMAELHESESYWTSDYVGTFSKTIGMLEHMKMCILNDIPKRHISDDLPEPPK